MVLLDCLLQFCLFGILVLAGFGGLAVELFGGELCEESCVSRKDASGMTTNVVVWLRDVYLEVEKSLFEA